MIFFDCERLKHPNTGLYHYPLNLANALAREAKQRGVTDLGFYVAKNGAALLDKNIPLKRVRPIDRVLLFDPRIQLCHSSSQLSHYQPLNGKKILTIHDLNYLYEDLTECERSEARSRVEKNLRHCSAIIAISEFVKRDIESQFDTHGVPVEVIYNGCNHYSGPIESPIKKPDGAFLFAVGNVMAKKNFHVLPALLVGNDYTLVISGIIVSEDYRNKIIDEARRYGVQDRVIITGPVSEPVKHWYLKNCAAFLHPSIAEGFGLPVVEAMRYGKPTFISDHTSLPEVGGREAFYFNHDFDADAMRREFEAGMSAFNTGQITPERLMARADQFSWEEAAKKHFDLYNRVLNR